MDLFRNVGRAIELLRKQHGLSQDRLARLAGIGKSQLSKYENGKEKPKLDSLERILVQLGISPAGFFSVCQLLDEAGDRLNRPEVEARVDPSTCAGILPDSTQQALEEVLRSILRLQTCMVRSYLRIDNQD